jgi:hypothetical protein
MHDNADQVDRNPSRHPHAALMPLSRVTAQMWGLEQLAHSSAHHRSRRRPVRAVAQWLAAALGR